MTTNDDPAALVARDPRRETWNAGSFRGAILRLGELVDVADERASALAFLRRGRALLER